ncbi:MAG TPA: hypothetical protein GX523_20405, partial [Desulfitobacterium dehalogenans]|nr:hypothetical protein [Desulfitobacterium dehalogenans]
FCTLPVSGKKIAGLAEEILDHYSGYEDLLELQRKNVSKHLRKHGVMKL